VDQGDRKLSACLLHAGCISGVLRQGTGCVDSRLRLAPVDTSKPTWRMSQGSREQLSRTVVPEIAEDDGVGSQVGPPRRLARFGCLSGMARPSCSQTFLPVISLHGNTTARFVGPIGNGQRAPPVICSANALARRGIVLRAILHNMQQPSDLSAGRSSYDTLLDTSRAVGGETVSLLRSASSPTSSLHLVVNLGDGGLKRVATPGRITLPKPHPSLVRSDGNRGSD
jgi:hypothetical protein